LIEKAIEGLPEDYIREQEKIEDELGNPGFRRIVD